MTNKKDEAVTRGVLDETVQAIIEGVNSSINEAAEAIIEGVTVTVTEESKKITSHMDTKFKHQKDDIDGLKAEFADTPSRQEFEELRKRVQQLEKSQLSN